MGNKIPTAEEFLKKKTGLSEVEIQFLEHNYHNITESMIEFAKLHVEAALKDASEDISEGSYEAMQYCILNAYPLTNIK